MAVNDGWESHGVYEPFLECNCCEDPLNDGKDYYELNPDWQLCQKCYDGFKKIKGEKNDIL